MDELHTKLICDKNNFVPKEGQRDLMCSNKESHRCPFLSTDSSLSKDTLGTLEELGNVLKLIRKRMYNEGYEIVDGNIRKKIFQDTYEKT